ncbi:hypothetical protein J5226_05095 [Lysobacter sp. K5869]|uniref:hypothetical protein n=1 Tax=Lysobacter sp. K5869 TaxID=2820808 RepID=UPI001C05F31E|nr:hypothetical protein [Lysobacter sp. K5869]QWP77792.1 hypothetical protein J5226_05095 [Lysobacter sp. K5869]
MSADASAWIVVAERADASGWRAAIVACRSVSPFGRSAGGIESGLAARIRSACACSAMEELGGSIHKLSMKTRAIAVRVHIPSS